VIITRSGGMDRNQVPRVPGAPRSPGKVTKAARDATSDPIPRVMRSLSRRRFVAERQASAALLPPAERNILGSLAADRWPVKAPDDLLCDVVWLG